MAPWAPSCEALQSKALWGRRDASCVYENESGARLVSLQMSNITLQKALFNFSEWNQSCSRWEWASHTESVDDCQWNDKVNILKGVCPSTIKMQPLQYPSRGCQLFPLMWIGSKMKCLMTLVAGARRLWPRCNNNSKELRDYKHFRLISCRKCRAVWLARRTFDLVTPHT